MLSIIEILLQHNTPQSVVHTIVGDFLMTHCKIEFSINPLPTFLALWLIYNSYSPAYFFRLALPRTSFAKSHVDTNVRSRYDGETNTMSRKTLDCIMIQIIRFIIYSCYVMPKDVDIINHFCITYKGEKYHSLNQNIYCHLKVKVSFRKII